MNSPRSNVSSKCVFLQNSTSRSRNSIYLVYPSNSQVMLCQTYDKEAIILSERYKYDHNLIRVRYSTIDENAYNRQSFFHVKKILCKAGKPENRFYIRESCEYGTTRLNSALNHITIQGAHKIFFLKHAAKILNSPSERDQKDYDGLSCLCREFQVH